MKKRQAALLFIKENKSLFQCPICHSPFIEVSESGPICSKGHTFDVSKKGTVHFLMKQSKNEYGTEMLESRHAIMEAGLFDPVLEKIVHLITKKEGVTLDAGCGEGTHLTKLSTIGLQGKKIGFDISKEGIQLAAVHSRKAFWCVADLSASPFGTEQFDTLLSILSPSHYGEFNRLLKKGGQVIKVVPEEHYLMELRQALYKESSDKQQYSNKEVVDHFSKQYPKVYTERITYTFGIPEGMRKELMSMTPLSWNVEEHIKHSFLNEGPEKVTVDLLVMVGEKMS